MALPESRNQPPPRISHSTALIMKPAPSYPTSRRKCKWARATDSGVIANSIPRIAQLLADLRSARAVEDTMQRSVFPAFQPSCSPRIYPASAMWGMRVVGWHREGRESGPARVCTFRAHGHRWNATEAGRTRPQISVTP